MNARIISAILCFCLLFNNLQAQNTAIDTIPVAETIVTPTIPNVEVNSFDAQLVREGENTALLFKSFNLNGKGSVIVNKDQVDLLFKNGEARHPFPTDERGQLLLLSTNKKDKGYSDYQLVHVSSYKSGPLRSRNIPLWMSILPPLIAIILALVFKEVIVSLFVGVWAGAFITGGLRFDSFYYLMVSFWEVVSNYVVQALADSDHISVIIFSLLIGGMVAIISRNGGMAGVVQSLSKYATSPLSSQFITWLLGVAIFFDDYANTLIVGNTMRSVTDKFNISREKLAYIVDSTAAPVSAVAFITTWIGAELGYIEDGIGLLENFEGGSAYSIFISSLKYSFYPILTLLFILIIIFMKRDFGGMYKAEIRARTTGQVSPAATEGDDEPNMEDLTPVAGAPRKWYHAAIPVFTVIFMTIFGLVDTGMASSYSALLDVGASVASSGWGDVWSSMSALTDGDDSFFMKIGILIGNSNSYIALLWASLSGVVVAILITLSARIMKLHETMHTMTMGFKTMLPALIILTMAWSLAIITKELHTATYLTSTLQGSINPYFMPMIIFILAAVIAFSTGSSWSTMAILYPIAIPTTWAICLAANIDPEIAKEILLNVIAVVLAASVLGDHCSPISDTTILSSLASDCNHIDHVRTQLPYALCVGAFSLACSGISTYLGGGWMVSFILVLLSLAGLAAIVRFVGKKVD